MKVIHILFSKGWGGLERYAIDTARQMAARGHEIYFVRRRGTPAAKALKEAGLPGEEWNPFKYADVSTMLKIRSLARGAEVVHAHQSADLGLIAPALWRMPEVKLIFSNYMQIPGPKTDIYHRLEYGRVDKVIVGARSMVDNAVANLPVNEGKVIHIPYGLDMERFDPVKTAAGAVREEYGLGDRPLIGVISRLDPHKGQLEMIEAMPAVLQKFPDAVLVLTGDETPEFAGRYKQKLVGKVEELGLNDSVIFTGSTEDTASLLADLDVYVLATHSETFSLGCLEAMAMQKPIVGTNSGGTPDMLDGGDCGLLAEPRIPASIAECVMKLLEDKPLAESLAVKARGKVEETYDRKVVMDRLGEVYKEEES